MSDEQRMTRDEWARSEQQRQCALDGHRPDTAIQTMASRIAESWVCDCRQVTWVRRKAEA